MLNVKLVYSGRYIKLRKLVNEVNEILRSNAFDGLVSSEEGFDMSSNISEELISGNELLFHINRLGAFVIRLDTYRPWWRWSKVNGMYKGGKTIYLNSRRLWRNEADIVNTIVHEIIHCLDTFITDIYIGHGSNSSVGKQNTTPWKVGKIAGQIYRELGHKDPSQIQQMLPL